MKLLMFLLNGEQWSPLSSLKNQFIDITHYEKLALAESVKL